MNKIIIIALATIVVACSSKEKTQTEDAVTSTSKADDGTTIDFNYMDLSVDPNDNFYQYSCGTWSKENPVPESETRWNSFSELQINNERILHEILETAASQKHEPGTVEQIIGDYYFSALDHETRNKQAHSPISSLLNHISEMTGVDQLPSVIAEHHNNGIPSGFVAGIEQDMKNNTRHLVYLSQGGLGLPGKSYYTDESEDGRKLQANYVLHIEKMLQLAGISTDEVEGKSAGLRVYEMENTMAGSSMTQTELRNYFDLYNKMDKAQQFELAPSFEWQSYYDTRGLRGFDTIIVSQPAFIQGIEKMMIKYNLDDWKLYLHWQVVHHTASFLSDDFNEENFNFFSKELEGQKTMKSDWKQTIDMMSESGIAEVLGHAFVSKQFSTEAKQRVNEMVDNIIAVYRVRIQALKWMTEETKKQAIAKLDAFTRKLGYPDEWTDYSNLKLTRESFGKNVLAVQQFAVQQNTDRLHAEVDAGRWEMAPHIVNAYYNPLLNEIVFPAGIMQPPFFDPSKEDAVNYARMGAVIGHELTHGFDDQGALFTKEGEFKNWWTEEDQLQFSARTKKLVNLFNSYEALPGLKINGQLTLGENIADFGGLTIAYYAYQKSLEGKTRDKIEGLTNEQRFFVAFAQIWKSNYTSGAMKLQVNTNPHAPGEWRVLGPLSNMPEFYSAFETEEGDAMMVSEEERAVIW